MSFIGYLIRDKIQKSYFGFGAMTGIKDLSDALALFEEAALKHAEATEQGDFKTGNLYYSILETVMEFLKEIKETRRLSEFLSHNSTGVRMWAATYLLPVAEREGLAVLEQISGTAGIHSLTAEMTVREWRNGNLKL